MTTKQTIFPGPFDVVHRAVIGVRLIQVPAGNWVPSKTSGCTAVNSYEIGSTNKKTIQALGFASASDSYAETDLVMPDKWDRGTITFKAIGYSVVAEDAADVVTFSLQGLAVGHNEDVDAAFGTAKTSIITVGASPSVTKILKSAVSAAITIAGTPVAGDTIRLKLGIEFSTT